MTDDTVLAKKRKPKKGATKKQYIARKSQATKKAPTKRLKQRRSQMTLMAQRGFKGAFPNPRKVWLPGEEYEYEVQQWKKIPGKGYGWRGVALFTELDMRAALQYARLYARRVGCKVRVVSFKKGPRKNA